MTKFSNFQEHIYAGPKVYFWTDLKHKIWHFCTKLYAFSYKSKQKLKKIKCFGFHWGFFSRSLVFLEILKLKNPYKRAASL